MSEEPTTTFKLETCPENDNCNLIVNYLPLSYRERHLLKLFSQIGDIKSCRVMRFVQDGRTLSKGYGFVKFGKLEEAQKAIDTLNAKNVLGKQIKVSFARPNSQRTKSNLFISQIPKEWSDLELKHQFSSCGKIIESRVLRTEKQESRRCGFVRFDNNEQAQLAMEKMNGFRPSPFDVPIRVRIATQHEKNKAKLDEPEKDKNKEEDDTRSEITNGTTLTYQSKVSTTATSVSRRQLVNPAPELAARPVPHHAAPAPSTTSTDYRRHHLETAPMRSDPAAYRRDPARAEHYHVSHQQHASPQYHRRAGPNNMLPNGSRHQHHVAPYHPHAPLPRPSYVYDHQAPAPRGYYPPMEPSYDYGRRNHNDYMFYEHEREMMMLDKFEHERFARYDRGYLPMHPSSMYDHPAHRTPSHAYALDLPVEYPLPAHSLPRTNGTISPASSTSGRERVSRSPTESVHTHPRHSPHGSTAGNSRSPVRIGNSRSPVRMTTPPATPQTTDIHIVGLPKEIVDSELRNRLKDFGDLEYVQIPKNQHGRGLGMAYASYVLAHSAAIAIKEMDGAYIADHRIKVSLA